MHQPQSHQLESVRAYGAQQSLENIQRAQELSHKLLDEIAMQFKPGMTESEAQLAAAAVFQKHQIVKRWHKPYIRFGTNTIYTFLDPPPEQDNILQRGDIAFVDIGPVFDLNGVEVEGDVGKTYVSGHNELFRELQHFSHAIFEDAVQYWHERKPTGIELYKFIHEATKSHGFEFNLPEAGHLVGTFPHTKDGGWRDGLNNYPAYPEPGVWIVEIQIRHPQQPYGSFFEDVLL